MAPGRVVQVGGEVEPDVVVAGEAVVAPAAGQGGWASSLRMVLAAVAAASVTGRSRPRRRYGTIGDVSLAILILTVLAAVAILAAVVLIVMGRAGEMSGAEPDYAPLDLPPDGPLASRDVTRLRLPLSLWGYHVRAVDELLQRVSDSLTAQEEHITALERRLAEIEDKSPAPQRPVDSE